jgi:hypothetical protein
MLPKVTLKCKNASFHPASDDSPRHVTDPVRRCTVRRVSWAALAPILILCLAFVVYCWVDIGRSTVRGLPKWAWAVIVAISIPLGGIVYLLVGRDRG